MVDRHWQEVYVVTGVTFPNYETVTLNQILRNDFDKYLDQLQGISDRARGEYKIETDLDDMEGEWKDMFFEYKGWPDEKSGRSPYT
jgi:hypothetical protein